MLRSPRRPASQRGVVRQFLAATAAATLALALTACGGDDGDSSSSSGSDSGTTAITVGVIPIIDVAPIYLGDEQGFFADEGLDLTLETAQGGAAIVPGVVSGQYQFGFSNVVSLMLAGSQDIDLKVVANGNSTTGEEGNDFGSVLVKDDSDIQSAADLAGKKVAVNTLNNINTLTISQVVRDAGGDPTTITFVELPFPDIVPAIESGDVDAGQVVEPFQTIGEQGGLRQVVSNFAGVDAELPIAMYFTSQEYADANPDVVEAFTAAMNKSLDYAQENADEARAILSEYTEIDPTVQEAVVLPAWGSEINRDALQKLAEVGVSDGVLPSEPDLDALLP